MAKDILFNIESRDGLKKGVDAKACVYFVFSCTYDSYDHSDQGVWNPPDSAEFCVFRNIYAGLYNKRSD